MTYRSGPVAIGRKPLRVELLDYFVQMRKRPRKEVDPHHYQRIAIADLFKQSHQYRPRTVSARDLLLVELGAAC